MAVTRNLFTYIDSVSMKGASVDLLEKWFKEECASYELLTHENGPLQAECRHKIAAIKEELLNRGVVIGSSRKHETEEPRSRPKVKSCPPAQAKQRIMYIECKTGREDRGGARVGRVSFSKTGRTIYYHGLVLRSLRGSGVSGNYKDVNTGLEYWVSGPKKNGKDRHWAGGGPVRIDPDVADEYWRDIRRCDPPQNPLLTG
jgi:hypothetical protein